MAWRTIEPEAGRVVIYGAGDQARVCKPILDEHGCRVEALIDDTPALASPFKGVPLLSGWTTFAGWLEETDRSGLGFVVAIGNPYGHVRCALHRRLIGVGLAPVSIADRTSLLSASASFGEGLQVMPRAVVHHHAVVGDQCILNTKALVEHDCVLEAGVEIGPGAILCGRVHVGAGSWIGAGAVVRQRLRVGSGSIVGAGAVVVTDIPDGVVAVGNPARPIRENRPEAAPGLAGASPLTSPIFSNEGK